MTERWNHNIHYHPLLLESLACVEGRVLDVGCGEGQFARSLAASATRSVVGIDPHQPSIDRARSQGAGVEYIIGDFLSHPFGPEPWDGIVTVAALHHMDLRSALERVRDLLRPRGVFAALGLARSGLRDLPWNVAGVVLRPWLRRGKTPWAHPSPQVWPPPMTYRQVRALAPEVLPGVAHARHVLFRYSLVWTKP